MAVSDASTPGKWATLRVCRDDGTENFNTSLSSSLCPRPCCGTGTFRATSLYPCGISTELSSLLTPFYEWKLKLFTKKNWSRDTLYPRQAHPVSASCMESLGLSRIKHDVLVLLLQDPSDFQLDIGPGWRVAETTAYSYHTYRAIASIWVQLYYPEPLWQQTSAVIALQRRRLGFGSNQVSWPGLYTWWVIDIQFGPRYAWLLSPRPVPIIPCRF